MLRMGAWPPESEVFGAAPHPCRLKPELHASPRRYLPDGRPHRVAPTRILSFLSDLLCEVILEADLLDRVELGFDPVDMTLFILDHSLQYAPRGVIANLGAVGDRLPEPV